MNIKKNNNKNINTHYWLKGKCLIAGYSMVEGIDESKKSSKRVIKIRKFPGATISGMYHYLINLLLKKPDHVIFMMAQMT